MCQSPGRIDEGNLMKSNTNNDLLQELFSAICDGRADDAQLERLGDLLQSDAKVRDEYLRYVDMHAALADELAHALRAQRVDDHDGHDLVARAPSELGERHRMQGSVEPSGQDDSHDSSGASLSMRAVNRESASQWYFADQFG